MELQFISNQARITPALKAFCIEKIKPLQKYYHQMSKIELRFYQANHLTTIQVIIFLKGMKIHAHAKANNTYTAIDRLFDKLQRVQHFHPEKELML
jgi:ribosomal subunit interface protein